ncbi:hypothetical protein S7335_1623 [Synechococcus sp. PCC 7335]|uniref:hypothetical protein n=1 Tax=Synechococcus sp. (strain ATCC 29403 / PCC 7335) TaxID=91464 RepID=UPI00017EE76B|nr:hypothetical protein [Synechococcus sp. PCC 7335]EDX83926.1 hypothetical protein S7335_1623 [Synechococcus sp. PCC 7335]
MLNTYYYSSSRFAIAYLTGALLCYAFSILSAAGIPTGALNTLESPRRDHNQPTAGSPEESGIGFTITHRGSGRIVPIRI